jgi:hypothetical protein
VACHVEAASGVVGRKQDPDAVALVICGRPPAGTTVVPARTRPGRLAEQRLVGFENEAAGVGRAVVVVDEDRVAGQVGIAGAVDRIERLERIGEGAEERRRGVRVVDEPDHALEGDVRRCGRGVAVVVETV